MVHCDVVIAGAGHNSLVTAAYLAKAGLKVWVIERHTVAGGNTLTEELTLPGFHHDACASAHNLIQSNPMLRNNELGLDRYGLEYLLPDPVVVIPFLDGHSITMYRDVERTEQELGRFSPRDAAAYRRLLRDWEAIRPVRAAEQGRAPLTPSESLRRVEAGPLGLEHVRIRMLSALEVIRERFENPYVRAFLLWMATMTIEPVDRPNTGELAFSLVAGRQAWSWTTPRGGSGRLAQALVAFVEAHGGRVLTGEPVVELVIEGGRAAGVRTAKGNVYRARRAVVSTIHVKHLVEMADRALWDPGFVQAVERWRPGLTMFVTHYALRTPPAYRTVHGPTPAVAMGAIESEENLLTILDRFRRGQPCTERPFVLAINSSLVDPSRAPAGMHTLKLVSLQPYELQEGPEHWDRIKDEVSDEILAHFLRYAPNITPSDILARHVESPLDLERRNPHNWRGSCHAGDRSPQQAGYFRPAPGWSGYRLPIPGLYQTGACTHPGGSVTGLPGRNAARAVLEDLGIRFDEVAAAPVGRQAS